MAIIAAMPNLGDLLNHDVYPRLTAEQVYGWPGHNWHKSKDKWRGCCPWHEGKSGSSFDVTPSSLEWYCAGCQVGGGPLQYLWRMKGGTNSPRGTNFVDMVREVCQLAGVPFPERKLTPEELAEAGKRAAKQSALETVYRLCQDTLWSPAGDEAREYLHGRGLVDDAIRDLELGLYPDLPAVQAALKNGGNETTINEGAWNKLVGYITFPWRDDYGKPLTLYGRWPAKTTPDERPKTTALPGEGSKGSPLYLDRALRAGHTDAVLVEGLLDSALLQALGERNVVAYVGATPSELQLDTLKRHKMRAATIVPDPDAGGDNGIVSFLSRVDLDIRAYVAPRLPDDLDPDEFVTREGIAGWHAHLAQAVRGSTYRTKSILAAHDLTTAKGRDTAEVEIVEYIGTLADEQERDELVDLAADLLGVKPKLLGAKVRKSCKSTGQEGKTRAPLPTAPIQLNGHRPDLTIPPNSANEDARPLIDAGEQDLPIVSGRAWGAIQTANNPPTRFRHASRPVRLTRDDHDVPGLEDLTFERMRYDAARCARWFTTKTVMVGGTPEKFEVKAMPPPAVVTDMLAYPELPLPTLDRIVEAPVFAPNGELQTAPGYHPASRTYYAPARGFAVPPVPTTPTTDELNAARALVCDELLGDFPFVAESDRAHAVALFLLPYVRDLIDGPTPLHLLEAPTPGSGKSLLAEVLLSPFAGRNVPIISEAKDDDEWRKRLSAKLVEAASVILIDNIVRYLDSGALSGALTTMFWSDRLLGVNNKTIHVPVRCAWVGTGNNVTLSTEIARRAVRSRIDPKQDRPFLREGFKHANLRAWTEEHRTELISAALTMVRHWQAQGCPAYSGKPLGSYERWSAVVGGILQAAGIPGFLSNTAEFYETADTEGQVWREFLGLWWNKFQDSATKASELFSLTENVSGFDLGKGGDRAQKTVFGRKLARQRDRVIGNFRVVTAGISHSTTLWKLQQASPLNGPGDLGDLGDLDNPNAIETNSNPPAVQNTPPSPPSPPAHSTFIPSDDWRPVPAGTVLPNGLETRATFGGAIEARLAQKPTDSCSVCGGGDWAWSDWLTQWRCTTCYPPEPSATTATVSADLEELEEGEL